MNPNKIIYIAIGAYGLQGVRDKIKAKVHSLNAELGEVHALYFCNDITKEIQEDSIRYIPFSYSEELPNFWKLRFFWRFQEYYIRKQKFKIVSNYIKQEGKFKVILFRYISADLNLFLFSVKQFKKIIFEHNIIELQEILLLKNPTIRNYYVFNEKIFGPLVRMCATALISVTNQIAEYQRKLCWKLTPSYTITNSIDPNYFPITKVPKYEGGIVHILFTAGYANIVHGVDLLLNSIKGQKNVHVHLIGVFEEDVLQYIGHSQQITNYGKLEGLAYKEVYEKCHIAVSPLAIYRKKLTEATSLKNREYACRGIPFILGHDDPDFTDPSITPFILKMEVNESRLIDFEKVKDFLQSIKNKDYMEMRNFAEKKLNYNAKAKEYQRIIETHFKK